MFSHVGAEKISVDFFFFFFFFFIQDIEQSMFSGADPGFFKRGFKCRKGRFVSLISL